jgi:hypothetical protein
MRDRPHRERWLHDVEARQRNVVFPDTVQNEGPILAQSWE